jgi:hypothetical protein
VTGRAGTLFQHRTRLRTLSRSPVQPRPRRWVSIATLAGLLLAPCSAWADARELYVLVEGAPALLFLKDPSAGQASTRQVAFLGAVTAYYGFTNSLHLGLNAHLAITDNVSFPGLSIDSLPQGTLYENVLAVGADALAAYRLDTGYPVAPVARLQFGGTYQSYLGQQLVTNDMAHAVALPDKSELVWGVQLGLGAEYRFGDHLVASLGVAARYSLSGLIRWQLSLPLTAGVIW